MHDFLNAIKHSFQSGLSFMHSFNDKNGMNHKCPMEFKSQKISQNPCLDAPGVNQTCKS